MDMQKVGPLDSICFESGSENCVVFFHGYGADAYDLAPLANEIRLKYDADFYFPNAPMQIVFGGAVAGRAWFPIDEKALEQAMLSRTFRDYASIRPPGIEKATKLAGEFCDVLTDRYKNVFLGGFSQGAMLTTDLVLHKRVTPKALMILSGTLLNRNLWVELMQAHEGLDVFQSHGEEDNILSYKAAEELDKLLDESGFKTEFHGFRGGHEIPRQILQQLMHFLNYRLKG